MAIYLKDDEIDRLAHDLAALEGVTLTEVFRLALAERRARLEAENDERLRQSEEIIARIHRLPVLDPRHPDEILYDGDGLPR